MNTVSQCSEQTRSLLCTCDSVWLAVNNKTSVTSNGFGVGSALHGQVSLASVNQIYVIHEAMNGCKNLKIH